MGWSAPNGRAFVVMAFLRCGAARLAGGPSPLANAPRFLGRVYTDLDMSIRRQPVTLPPAPTVAQLRPRALPSLSAVGHRLARWAWGRAVNVLMVASWIACAYAMARVLGFGPPL